MGEIDYGVVLCEEHAHEGDYSIAGMTPDAIIKLANDNGLRLTI